MVDALRLQRLLRGITDRIAQLRREADADDARRADPLWLPGVKYLFVTAIEGCIDVAQHVRNVLVHDYVAVHDATVIARLNDLSDLNAFVSALVRLAQESP